MATGITKRHARNCKHREGRCSCDPSYEAWVWSERDGKKIRKSFTREAEAKTWRADALSALSRGALRAPARTTIRQAWDEWETGAKSGAVRNRSGDIYKPSALRGYEQAMRLRVLPKFGSTRVTDPRRPDLQDFADKLLADGLNPSTIQVTLLPLRAIYRRALGRGEVAINPCTGLQLPAVRGRRERYAAPQEAEALLKTLPVVIRPIWATAMYAGLRRGELQALRAQDVDLAGGRIWVERGWDFKEGVIELKSKAGRRKVPIAAVLRDFLMAHRIDSDREGEDLLFGRDAATPFRPETLQQTADTAWKDAKLSRITLHECRHTFASLMIAAGVNAKALQSYMGHANISITLDRYGHLMPGAESEAADLLDAYLTADRQRVEDAARSAGDDLTGAPTGAHLAHTG